MGDVYAIDLAKTEFREAYNTGDVGRLLAILDDGLVEYSEGRPSGYHDGAKTALRSYLQDLFTQYHAHLATIVVEVTVTGNMAVDHGWHDLTLTPRSGGEPIMTRKRYIDVWKKDQAGNWKLVLFMDNTDVPDRVDAVPAA